MPRRDDIPSGDVLAGEYRAGATAYDLAAKYDTQESTIRHRLRQAGADLRRRGRRTITPADTREEIVRLRDQGTPWRKIAERVGMSYTGVRRSYASSTGSDPWCRGAGQPVDPETRLTLDREVVELRGHGLNSSEVGYLTGTTGHAARHRYERIAARRDLDETDAEIIDLRESRLDWTEIAYLTGLPDADVRQRYSAALAAARYQGRSLHPGVESRIVAEYEAGDTAAEIADREGVTSTLIYRVLHAHGVTMRPAHRRPREWPDVSG